MKFSLVALAAIIASTEAITKKSVPSLTLSVKDGSYAGIDSALDPTLTLNGEAASGDLTFTYGVEASAAPTTDVVSLVKKVAGSVSWSGEGSTITADISKDMDEDYSSLDITGSVPDQDLELTASGIATNTVQIDTISASKKFGMDSGDLTVSPTFYTAGNRGQVEVAYSTDDTDITVTVDNDMDKKASIAKSFGATKVAFDYSADEQTIEIDHSLDSTDIKLTVQGDSQEVTITQQLDDDNKISPTINRDGGLAITWERDLGDDNSLTTTLTKDESLEIEWKDDNWTANLNAELDGTSIGDVSIHASRDITF